MNLADELEDVEVVDVEPEAEEKEKTVCARLILTREQVTVTTIMVRNYKKKPGTRNYKNYADDHLEEAIEKVTNGDLSMNAASIQYKIPYGTLYNKYKGMHGSTPGGQPVFTHLEEKAILKGAATCADYGFPLTTHDLRMFAKYYLDKEGKTVEKFINNLPGVDWALSVLKRHKNQYGQRLATNIKRARAEVDQSSINAYFDNLQREVAEIPASNIFNYDESNLSDDPGKKKCIYRRGVKYPEKVMNHSKSCTTVMICGAADGTLLPPYVIYKSTHLYDTWKEGGIVGHPCCSEPCCSRGGRYNRTTSGWIDGPTFRDWFMTCFLPHANRLEGRKVLIGDNLSSHIDVDVVEKCQSHNISFVCLVPNSTHICQPLDVGFFRPMKTAWRKTIDMWKNSNSKAATIPKEVFPKLLKKALIQMDNVQAETYAVKRDLISSFVATGIYPLNRFNVLKKIPDNSSEAYESVEATVSNHLTDFLKEKRYGNPTEPSRKKKRLNVEPGKSIATLDESEPSIYNEPIIEERPHDAVDSSNSVPQPSTSTVDDILPSVSQQNVPDDDDVTDCEDVEDIYRADRENLRPIVGNFVLAKFPSAKGKKQYQYLCMIEDICDDKIVVLGFKTHKKKKNVFRAVENDVSCIEETDILAYLPRPNLKDGLYIFPADINVIEL